MVEVAIVSLLRELIVVGLHQLNWSQMAGVSLLLVVLGGILAVDRWVNRTDENAPPGSAH